MAADRFIYLAGELIMKQQRESTTSMQAALLRAMVKAGIDKRQQPIKAETIIPQSTKANQTFVPTRLSQHPIRPRS